MTDIPLKIHTNDDKKLLEKENDAPHSAPLLSLLYNSASTFLSHIVADSPKLQNDNLSSNDNSHENQLFNQKIQSVDKDSVHNENITAQTDTSLVSFIYDLAGFGNNNSLISPIKPDDQLDHPSNPPSDVIESEVPYPNATALFDASELKEFDFEETIEEKPTHDVYVPVVDEKIKYDKPIVDSDLIEELVPSLPIILRESTNVVLLYSIEKNGISLNTLYSKVNEQGPCLIAIKDIEGNVFGAFVSESIHTNSHYYGNGQCFLWKKQDGVKVFPATGKNDYMVLTDAHCIALGGGEGKFGLWIDEDLYNGHSEKCATFGNERLAIDTEFCVAAFEIWGFVI
ncbi:TLD-domain-containing protein [Globomyces pollinis-pini]|nr:TLD-domain-containing protein [Globomyces pollinis-pini]